jgi:O-antigen/teichoic acid export membrane protein
MLIRHSALYTAAKILPGLLTVATTAALTRLLNPHEYGLYGLAHVIMTLGSIILFHWLSLSFLRFYQSRQADPNLVSTFISMFLIIVILSAVVFGVALISGVVPKALFGLSVIGLLMIWASSWFELVSRLAVAEFEPIKYLKMNFARALLILIAASAIAWLTRSPIWTAMATGAGIFSSAFFGKLSIPRPALRRFDYGLARDVVVFGAPMVASLTLFVLVDGGTRILLEQLDSPQALGLYTAASILSMSTIGILADGVASAGYSLAVREVERGDHRSAQRQLLANGTLLMAVAAPAALGIALTGNCIATTFVGSKFVSGVAPLMPWMAALSFLNSFRANHLDHAFQLGKRSHLQIWVMGLAGLVTMGVSIYLIPRDGPMGATIAVTVGYGVACIHSMIAGRYAYPIPLPIAAAIRVGICCIIMVVVIVNLPDNGLSGLILRATFGAIAYALAALAVNLLESRALAIRLARTAFARLKHDRIGVNPTLMEYPEA